MSNYNLARRVDDWSACESEHSLEEIAEAADVHIGKLEAENAMLANCAREMKEFIRQRRGFAEDELIDEMLQRADDALKGAGDSHTNPSSA